MSRIDKYIETESRLAVVYLLGEEKLRIYYGGGCTILNILKANCTPWVNYVVCKLYFSKAIF